MTVALVVGHRDFWEVRPGQPAERKTVSFPNYGATRHGGAWYFTSKGHLRTEGAELDIKGDCPTLANPHQLDWIDPNTLAITDTHRNRIVFIHNGILRFLYPNGRLKQNFKSRHGIPPSSYCHFNSIFSDGPNVYLMAHNYTERTGKPSEIWVLDRAKLRPRRRLRKLGASCHNVIIFRGKVYWCDSGNGRLIRRDLHKNNREVVFEQPGEFMRGLSITDEHIIVGTSNLGRRLARGKLGGSVYWLDHSGNLLASVELPGCGQVCEVRALEVRDYGLSLEADP